MKEIPEKFAMNLREKLGEVVSLKVPSGAIWEVGLENEIDSLTLKLGWNRFIKDNGLKENDIVIFKHNGSSVFDVMFFDGKNLCEKEDSYFVRKCDHPDMAREEKRMGDKDTAEKTLGREPRRRQPPQDKVNEQVEESFEAGNASEDDNVLGKDTAVKSSGKVLRGRQPPQDKHVEQVEESFEAGNASEDDNVLKWKLSNKSCKDDLVSPSSVRKRAASDRLIRRLKRNSIAEVRLTPLEYYSNRRPVTEEEKANAEQRANAEASIESLVIVMKEYNVYRRFFLTVPCWWSNDYLPNKHVIMKLQLGGKIWPVKFNKRYTGGVIIGGWKMFSMDNSLEEGDVCLFNIISNKSDPIVMEVKIFRVVEEVVPPTPLRPTSSSCRGPTRGRKLY
ncbi:hypothetical protein LIER_41981 [Lithospermum erythrorhizon]|uniref:TF-B3 domain-containing protein n=1 Tax=Lithospermum erythrorhizon TaxID=34254 RepID=A0AAV3RNC4_LITER